MEYVIRRHEDGKFLARPDSKHSYTHSIRAARKFANRESAKADCCDNESPVSVDSLMGGVE